MKLKGESNALRRCYENQAAYDAKHELPHRILGIGMGGGFCCVRIAAILEAFADEGLTHPFTAMITVSGAGGPVGGYLSGVAHRVPAIFEYLAVTDFITWNPWMQMYNMQLTRFERVLTGEEIPFNFDDRRIRAHPTRWFVTAARENGIRELLDAKTVDPHPARAVCASSAMPYTCEPVTINGVRLVDGIAGGNPLPIEEGLELLRDEKGCNGERPVVIVMQSRTHPKHRTFECLWWEQVVRIRYALAHPGLRENLARSEVRFGEGADRLSRSQGVEWCRIAPTPSDADVSPFYADVLSLRKVRDETTAFMRDALKAVRPARHV